MPEGRRIAKKYNLIEHLKPLPSHLWSRYSSIEAKLRYAIDRYPADWRERIRHHERAGIRVRLSVSRGTSVGDIERRAREFFLREGLDVAKVSFCGPADYTGRRRPGCVLVCVDANESVVEGLTVDWSGGSFEWLKTLYYLLNSSVKCWDFIQPDRGCRYNFRHLYHHGAIPKWLLDLQAGWRIEYGVHRSLVVGGVEDFFADAYLVGSVIPWPGCLTVADKSFQGKLLMLPSILLTESEFALQQALVKMNRVKAFKTSDCAFVFVTIIINQLYLKNTFLAMANGKRGFTFIVPKDKAAPAGPITAAVLKEMLTYVLGSVDRVSRLAMTLFSSKSWDRDCTVLTVTPCVSYRDGMDVFLLREILAFPNRICFMGRKGCGKSRLARLFSDLSYNILDSDTYGRVLWLCKGDYQEESRAQALSKYIRLTKDERDAVETVFETEMNKSLVQFKEQGLQSYIDSGLRENVGRLHLDLYESFSVVYDDIIRAWTPYQFQQDFIKAIEDGGFDDLGLASHNMSRTVIFVHCFPELMQSMSTVIGELIPAHDTRAAISLRGQGLSLETELHLHDFYVAKSQQGVRKIGVGWLIHELQRVEKDVEGK
nr:MAG: VP10 [Shelly headland virus]